MIYYAPSKSQNQPISTDEFLADVYFHHYLVCTIYAKKKNFFF